MKLLSLIGQMLPPWGRKAPGDQVGNFQLRDNQGQGAYTKYYRTFVPRKVNAEFMEFLRESIPIVDGAINRLVALDGHIVVKGENEELVEEIKEFLYNVKVNDFQKGVHAFQQCLTSEAHEQGFALGEFALNKKRDDIIGLKVADSKFIQFKPTDNGEYEITQKLPGKEEAPLKLETLMYFGMNNENQNPYGIPMMRSCEFVAQAIHTIQNAVKNNWERFGDPSYSIIYKTSKKDGTDLQKRRQAISDEFAEAIKAKRNGQSADFIRAIDVNSDIEVKIIGADGQILEMEVPMRHLIEQIVAKTGLPAWMLGLHWSTTEGLSDAEAEMVLADVETRRAGKLPLVYNLIRTLLAVRGRAWKKGDWYLEWAGINLRDVVKQAQARFLNAQADMYYMTNAAEAGIDLDINDLALGKSMKFPGVRRLKMSAGPCGCKELGRANPWPELDKAEDDYVACLQGDWAALLEDVKMILKLGLAKSAKEPESDPLAPFGFTEEQRTAVMDALKGWTGQFRWDDPDSPLAWYYGQAYSLGLIQAAQAAGKENPLLSLIKNREIFETLTKEGFLLLKNKATKAIVGKILPEMQAHALSGSNPLEVGKRLEKLFGDKNSDWERLARSEMAMAAEQAKGDEWEAWDVETLEFSPAPDACPICKALAGEYPIKECPLPVRDTHPRCRCARNLGAGEVDR